MVKKLTALIAGPTDKTKLFRFGKINQSEYKNWISNISKVLEEELTELHIIPDDGVPLDIAKKYKELGGNNVIGYVPKNYDNQLKQYFNFCDDIRVFDGNWTALNTSLSLKGNLIIAIGLSSGTMVEIAYTKYHNKYLKKDIPILTHLETMGSRLPVEIEDEINIIYFNNNEQLKKILIEYKYLIR